MSKDLTAGELEALASLETMTFWTPRSKTDETIRWG